MQHSKTINFFLILTFWLFLSSSANGDENNKKFEFRNHTIHISKTAVLDCLENNDTNILWLKEYGANNSVLLFAGSYVAPTDKRLQLLSNNSLFINDVKLSDAGNYTCVLPVVHEKIRHQLEILTPPVISETNNTVVVEKGKEVTLQCNANGNPKPTISWERKNSLPPNLNLKNEVLKFTAKSEYSGYYKCIASNEVGTVEQSYLVDVRFLPEIVISEEVDKKDSNLRYVICSVRANPQPNFQLYKVEDSNLINQAERKNIVDIDNPFLTTYKITYRVTSKTEYGRYNCKAENAMGGNAAFHEVTKERPIPPPAVFTNIPANQIVDSNFELNWQVFSEYPIIRFDLKTILMKTNAHSSNEGLVLDDSSYTKIKSENKVYFGSHKLSNIALEPGTYKFSLNTVNSYSRSNESEVILNVVKLANSSAFSLNYSFFLLFIILVISQLMF